MYSYSENPDLNSILSACLNHIQLKRPEFKRTKSQIPATSELWFIEVDLKIIHSLPEFLNWVKEKFAPRFLQHRTSQNKHVANVFNNIAQEILNQIQRCQSLGKENQDFFVSLLSRDRMKKSSECSSTPPLTVPLDYEEMEVQDNWSDTIIKQ